MKINLIPQNLYLKQTEFKSGNFSNVNIKNSSNLAPLNRDVVSFSQRQRKTYERRGGMCEHHFKNVLEPEDIYKRIPLMMENEFTPESYKKLSEKDKDFLRGFLDEEYMSSFNSPVRLYDEYYERTIERDMQLFLKISQRLKQKLDKKYPQGYKFISIGGSAAIFADILKMLKAESFIVPYSKSVANYPDDYCQLDFKKYFEAIGLSKEYLNDGKKNIFTDFRSSGRTFELFKKEMEKAFGQVECEPVEFKKLIADIASEEELFLIEDFFFDRQQIKSYSTCPDMKRAVQYQNAQKMKEEFCWPLSAKLMHFALIDCMKERGII